jgi:hypothetical protein
MRWDWAIMDLLLSGGGIRRTRQRMYFHLHLMKRWHAPRTPSPSQTLSTTTIRSTRSSHKPLPCPSSSSVPLRLAHAPTKRSHHVHPYQECLFTPDQRLLREKSAKSLDIYDAWRMEVGWCRRSVRRRSYLFAFCGERTQIFASFFMFASFRPFVSRN